MSQTFTLEVKGEIEGGEWGFYKGQFLEGYKEADGTWKVWQAQDYCSSFICGGPESLLYVFKNSGRTTH